MQRRNFLRVIGGSTIFAATAFSGMLAGCSSQLPRDAVAVWHEPLVADSADPRRWILAHALLAPHAHNLQSWLVSLSKPDEITLYLDRTRMLPHTDPFSRQMMMSQGTFLELLDQAARQQGMHAEINLFPEGAFSPTTVDARPTARIRLVRDVAVKPDPLFAQVLHRHTNRENDDPRMPTVAAMNAITASKADPGMRSGVVTSENKQAVAHQRRIAKEAWRTELVTPRTMLESLQVLRIGPDEISEHRDGISINDPMMRVFKALGMIDRTAAPGPDSMGTQGQLKKFNAAVDSTQAFYWLVTEGNDRVTQINAGRAWIRAQLAATAQGLSMHPLSQALQEYPEVADLYREIHNQLDAPTPRFTVQMWARLGYGQAVGPAPRRGLDAHIMKA